MDRDPVTIELVVQAGDALRREVGLRLEPGASARDMATALAPHLGNDEAADVFVPRLQRWLEPAEPVESLGLARGDVVFLGDRAAGPPPITGNVEAPETELVVVGGPAMGARWPLKGDRLTIGRARDCDVTVEDAAMSRIHLELEVDAGTVRVSDAGSTNGTFIDGKPLPARHEWEPGDVLEAGASLLAIQPKQTSEAPRPDTRGTIAFNRPPRIRSVPPTPSFRTPAAPHEVERPRLPLIAAGVPLLLALILWRLLPDSPAFLAILALSPLIALLSYVDERRRGTRSAGKAESSWRVELDSVVAALDAARAAAAQRLRDSAPGASELERRAISLDPALWLRRPDDDDFLSIRFGWGDKTWDVDVQRDPGGSTRLRAEAEERLSPLLTVPSVPLTLPLREVGVVGVAGDEPAVADAIRWWVAQIATLHSPAEVSIVALPPSEDVRAWNWMRWLPHAAQSFASAVDDRVEALTAATDRPDDAAHPPHATVAVIHESGGLPRAKIARVLRDGKAKGIYVIWVGSQPEALPGECRAIVEVDSTRGDAVVTYTEDGSRERGALEGLNEESARTIPLALAPVADETAAATRARLPAAVTLFDVLDAPATSEELSTRWKNPPPGLRATVGRAADGPFALDLVTDGPHALIAGTTGSGKSELLQTLIASLVHRYPPSRLNFLLVDYKGGAAFKDCATLPHTVGSVTDLDGVLAHRALVSLEAELRRRETILRDAGVSDISELANEADSPARLVLMIDEFATLVKELPAFVDGVVDIAQRGRSLGLHLILATQRPAGVINDAVRANTNLRIALRMADAADSIDVIGSDRAARIPRHVVGRAFVKSGPTEPVEIQTAQATARARTGTSLVEVWDLDAGSDRAEDPEGGASTQLEVVVEAARHAGRAYPAQRSPWLPPLPELVVVSDLGSPSGVAIGLLDEPNLQRQAPALLDLDRDGGALIYGTGGAGKTNLLITIGASLAREMSPDDLHLYALDAASGQLGAIASLPHCGDIVASEDVDRVRRLLFMLLREIETRKSRGSQSRQDPRIVVLLDGYAAFASAFDRIDLGELVDLVPRLIADGRGLGIHFAITAERRASIPAAIASLIPKKIVLRLGDPDEYAAFGLNPREVRAAALPPGRGFIDGTTFQAAVVTDPKTSSPADSLRYSGEDTAIAPRRAKRVQVLPDVVEPDELEPTREANTAAFALAETDMTAAIADLRHGHFLVAGPYRSGRSTALAAIARAIAASTPDARLQLLAPRRSPAAELGLWSSAMAGMDRCEQAIAALAAERDATEVPIFLFVDDAEELAEGAAAHELEALVKRGRDGALRVVAATERGALHRAFGGWLLEVRKDGHGLLLAPDLEVDGDLLGTRLPRRSITRFPPGRGFLVERGRSELVQVAAG